MGGGPSTPRLAAAVSNAGGLGFLAGAYLTPEQLADEIRRTRALTREPFGVNLFAGGYHQRTDRDPSPILDLLGGIHRELGLPPPSIPSVPPDPFRAQLEVVLAERPAFFSFTFGIPSGEAMAQLREAAIIVFGTATSVREGVLLEGAGVNAVVAQGAEAGAHRGSFAGEFALVPTLDLVRELSQRLTIPVIASGGLMTGADVARACRAGASAVQLGTAFLACDESGASKTYREALRRARGGDTVITRAFSGRAARGIRNAFVDQVGVHRVFARAQHDRGDAVGLRAVADLQRGDLRRLRESRDERIFVYRALCIARGDSIALESFNENLYVAGANFDERTLADLLREYALVRGATIAFFDALSKEAWSRKGRVAGYEATVRGLAFHIAGHELHHLRVLKERYLAPR